ncbi:MAG: pseudouridine-5'-phosphate glycosidase [Candidatus Dormibacteraeota bacterium]|nr:pseudouridine-5'-phosphate glycosidase [Candidatus Dormibacteraeota bacterium]
MAFWPVKVAPEVAAALREGGPVVVLETSIVAQGLPAPHNLEAAFGCEAAIREEGGFPATVAVRQGALQVGLSEAELRALAEDGDVVKVSTRDLGAAIALGSTGATTVAATVRAAGLAGIRFMATGGIGGVHIGHPEDVSADLYELAQSPVAVFCAGAKTVLDLALTLERLESYEVPVLGWHTDDLPGFYIQRTGYSVSATVSGPEETARVLQAGWGTGLHGAVVAVPPPGELPGAIELVSRALTEVGEVTGSAVTPRLLAKIAELSGGRSVELNVELVINNARAAAQTAVAFSRL